MFSNETYQGSKKERRNVSTLRKDGTISSFRNPEFSSCSKFVGKKEAIGMFNVVKTKF